MKKHMYTVKKMLKLTLKSSLAWAPLLSFLCSAEWMVWTAFSIRFCSSNVSTRSVFHTMPGGEEGGKKGDFMGIL